MSYKTFRSLCIDFIIFFIPVVVLWKMIPYILSVILPFVYGYIIFLIARPVNRRLKDKIPDGINAAVSLSFILVFLFVFIKLLLDALLPEISSLTESTGEIYNEKVPYLTEKISGFSKNRNMETVFSSVLEAFRTQFIKVLADFAKGIVNFAKNIPAMVISLFATVFTAFFLLKDRELFAESLKKFFGKTFCMKASHIKESFLSVTLSYLKAQLVIESIIFFIILVGFLFLEVRYAVVLAFVAALVDAVPVLGTGTVLVPMSVFYFLSGENKIAWGLLIVYGVSLLARQLCEPKILGDKLGIHPLLSVFAIFTGLKLFGIIGLILGPIIAIFVKNIISARSF